MRKLAMLPFLILLLIPIASALPIEYTPAATTVCDGRGVCTKTLYSGTVNALEDGKWVPVEKARSLKGAWKPVYLEVDKDFSLEFVDYNYTSLILHANFTGNPIDYPDECTYKSAAEYKCQFKVADKGNESAFKFDYKYEVKDGQVVADTYKIEYKGNPLGIPFKFGGNSTTVQLQDADTENLDDTYVSSYNPDTSYGAGDSFYLNANVSRTTHSLIKFAQDLPTGSAVISAQLFLNSPSTGGAVISSCGFDNQTWDEETATWNNYCTGCVNCSFFNSTTSRTGWNNFNVTSWVSNQVGLSRGNISFFLNTSYEALIGKRFYAKEYGDDSLRPYLNITYEYGGSPEWSGNQSSTPSEYNPAGNMKFNVTWNTSDSSVSNISTVFIEGNWSGTAKNYSMSNATFGGSIFNYTCLSVGAGDYYWKSWANETLNGVLNITDTWAFTIAKNSTNPTRLNITTKGVTYQDKNVSTQSDQPVTLAGGLDFSSSGTATLFIDGVATTNPRTQTFGVGTYLIASNTSGNANYSANATGASFYLFVTAPSTGGGDSGGASGPPGFHCGPFDVYPTGRLEIMSPSGTRAPPATLQVYNGNQTQMFGLSFSDELVPFCTLTKSPAAATPADAIALFEFTCLVPEKETWGTVLVTAGPACQRAVTVVLLPAIGIEAQFASLLRLVASGDSSGFLITYHGLPLAIIAVVVIIFVLILVFW